MRKQSTTRERNFSSDELQKAPTPYCINGVVMRSDADGLDGNGTVDTAMITVWE